MSAFQNLKQPDNNIFQLGRGMLYGLSPGIVTGLSYNAAQLFFGLVYQSPTPGFTFLSLWSGAFSGAISLLVSKEYVKTFQYRPGYNFLCLGFGIGISLSCLKVCDHFYPIRPEFPQSILKKIEFLSPCLNIAGHNHNYPCNSLSPRL